MDLHTSFIVSGEAIPSPCDGFYFQRRRRRRKSLNRLFLFDFHLASLLGPSHQPQKTIFKTSPARLSLSLSLAVLDLSVCVCIHMKEDQPVSCASHKDIEPEGKKKKGTEED